MKSRKIGLFISICNGDSIKNFLSNSDCFGGWHLLQGEHIKVVIETRNS